MNQSSLPPTPEPAQWAARARRLLLLAKVVGVAIASIGAILFLGQTGYTSLGDLAGLLLGMAGVPFGLGILFVTIQSEAAGPVQAYRPRELASPRKWFILIWIVGLIASLTLHVEHLSDLKPVLAVTFGLAAALAWSGGQWCFRWLSAKLQETWPVDRLDQPAAPLSATSGLPPWTAGMAASIGATTGGRLRWPSAWVVAWSGLGGVLSAALAFGLEALGIVLVLPLLSPTLSRLSAISRSQADLTARLLDDPTIVFALVLGIAVVAPMIEEASKALTLRVLHRSVQWPIDGLLLGMASGLGFGLAESTGYLTELSGFWFFAAWLRLVTMLMHGITTSIVGLAYTRSRRLKSWRMLLAGYARAVTLHGVWNAVAIGTALTFATGAYLASLIGIVLLGVLMARVLPRTLTAGVESTVQESYAQAGRPLPPEWSPEDYGIGWRLVGSRPDFSFRRPWSPPTPEGSNTPEQP